MIIYGEEHNDLCVGIDLGTTNSVLATINVKQNGDAVSKVVEIPRAVDIYSTVSAEAKLSSQKKPTLPSCVYYREEKNFEPLVGDFAKIQYPLRPHLVAKSIKSQMGKPDTEGLSADIPDKTPAKVSSRILNHLLRNAEKIYKCQISDAVITVPANFDSVMCKATRDAAELAGIKVKNEDGSERPVLLSEPNAVIYDLINQIHNGEISNRIIDLTTKKNVLVFDLGGGTLDITMHEIKRRDDFQEVLKVDEIATNRYTLLGGDDFDEAIANEMFLRYIKQYENHPEIVKKLRHEEKRIKPQLRNYAEQLKLELSERCSDDYSSGWDDEEEDMGFPVGGNMGGIGYAYDDSFTKEEIEGILQRFMGENIHYNDYKRIEQITSTRNIMYPILDVLNKASKKLETEDVFIDAVIVNGGMSKFYMITDRLTEFFGFSPIVALDPDQSVARGAAVYHYYLHKYEELKDDMRLLGVSQDLSDEYKEELHSSSLEVEKKKKDFETHLAIEWGKNILNDSLYLGVRNGAVHMIIPTGAELPYQSDVMTGFKLMPEQNMIAIPIKSQNIDGTYRTIANGNINFKKKYYNGAYVSFTIFMGSNKVISMNAWTSMEENGKERIEEGSIDIAIESGEYSGIKAKFVAPKGSILRPKEEINNVLQLCKNYEKIRSKNEKSTIAKKIKDVISSICNAENKNDFAEVVLDALENCFGEYEKQRLFYIARKLGNEWTESERDRLSDICMKQISADLQGLSMGGATTSTNIQAIYTLSICASKVQLDKLKDLHENSKYLEACLYTHAKTKTQIAWIHDKLRTDINIKNRRKRMSSNLQFSSYSMGVALRKDNNGDIGISEVEENEIVKEICDVILTGNITIEELICCILALGWICDQRGENSRISSRMVSNAIDVMRALDSYYSDYMMMKCRKAQEVAIKMMRGDILNEEDERFLLTKLERY
ncbi:MAG: Hsp70 family protein [Lachnospiraceae bacterium]|jgi:molecular chaperone DnaK (HSP70)|nr:Hsp70 family protein [Lachnospiraceae bacterium]